MELKQKGSEANVGGFKQLMVSMKWTTAADFDLAAAYEDKSGKQGLIYFGEQGDLNTFPFMQLSGDEGDIIDRFIEKPPGDGAWINGGYLFFTLPRLIALPGTTHHGKDRRSRASREKVN